MTFKLPDFLYPGPLDAIRLAMNAPLAEYRVAVSIAPIDLPVPERLGDKGIDVAFDEIEVLPDQTLAYKGYRVLLYIRDIASYGDHQTMPKFHLAYCRTLEKMRSNHRFERYVVANRDDGRFAVNVIASSVQSMLIRLHVCQNCLSTLAWDGFSYDLNKKDRSARVEGFSLPQFFSEYPRDLMSVLPKGKSDTAPINDYTSDWSDVSTRIRKSRGHICESCGFRGNELLRPYLHVHHRDGQKFNNTDSNLRLLCIGCHADEPMHGHLKATKEYRDYMSMRSRTDRR